MPELNEYAAKNLTLFQSICNSQSTTVLPTPPPPPPHFSSSTTSSIFTQNEATTIPFTSSPCTSTSSCLNQLASPNSTQNFDTFKINLLDWTNLTDPRHKLETVLEKAKESFLHLDTSWWNEIESEVKYLISEGNNKQMKEIEGLTKRLSDLNTLLESSRQCLNREKEICDVNIA